MAEHSSQALIARAEALGFRDARLDDFFRAVFADGRSRGFRTRADEERFARELDATTERRSRWRKPAPKEQS